MLAGDRVLGPRDQRRLRLHGAAATSCARTSPPTSLSHAAYEVEVMGVRYPAVRHTRPLYDPDRKAILA